MHFSRSATSAACLAWLLGGALHPSLAVAANPSATPDALAAANIPALMLASDWSAKEDPSAHLVSEKLDGVRALWDGQTLRFRSGRVIAAPGWFTAALPAVALDGELWLGRDRFDELSGLVRRATPVEDDWRQVRYMVFDLPGAPEPFAERVQRLQGVLAQAAQPWLQAVPQQRVSDAQALQALLATTVQGGGEGLVLHRADALWSPGRSSALRKLKPQPDDEARVVGHLPGKGRLSGQMGALLLELPSGQRFALGSGFSDAQRADPPPIGSLVTYRYRERTPKGVPRFASFLRVRNPE
ncbi:DNA ligase [Rhodoferax sp. BLA1]|uniref:DNA ligase n=1 Tax=Rhodoferax sp. BLA1 TaxID=2576062 RepID=UPI0015D2A70D|nr:DNA ligase [Rhodoferax sp. BLA1]